MSIVFDYRQQALCFMFVPTLLLLLMISFVHETPEFLYRQKKYEVTFSFFTLILIRFST